MTVEAWLKAKIPNYDFDTDLILQSAVLSPALAEPEAMSVLNLDDRIEDIVQCKDLKRSLLYAESTLYYAVSGVFSGGSKSEQIGDVKITKSGITITQSDRDYYRKYADRLRESLGCEVETDPNDDNGMFDATTLGWD